MTRHLDIAKTLGARVYFCDSRSPWQRGSNENTNGLLRQFFPKGIDLAVHTPGHPRAVKDELNRRPRIVLDERAVIDLFNELLEFSRGLVLRRKLEPARTKGAHDSTVMNTRLRPPNVTARQMRISRVPDPT